MGRRANNLLRQARLRMPSPSGSGQPMSRADLAEAANRWLYEQTKKTFAMDANQIGKYERGENRWPHLHYRQALCAVLDANRPADLGFYPHRTTSASPAEPPTCGASFPLGLPNEPVEQPAPVRTGAVLIARLDTPVPHADPSPAPRLDIPVPRVELGSPPDPGNTGHHESVPFEPPPGETMRRRSLLGLSASALFAAAVSADTRQAGGPDLVTALTSHTEPTEAEPVSPHVLATTVAAAKRQYQSCL
ncbi:MAG: hypothetical protein HKP61_07100 [Dactylosporangium sp.]|nr:hypothetical protein [Dactylosporangium sp.]NNJ60710.1 hypothetical protein [Dactylosporangium sp.]